MYSFEVGKLIGLQSNLFDETSRVNDIEINFPQIFKNQDLEIFTIEKENYTFHRVWTKLMLKNGALDLCKSLKKIKVNCILQIDEG